MAITHRKKCTISWKKENDWKELKNENKTVDKEKNTWYIIHVNKGNTYSDELKKEYKKI